MVTVIVTIRFSFCAPTFGPDAQNVRIRTDRLGSKGIEEVHLQSVALTGSREGGIASRNCKSSW